MPPVEMPTVLVFHDLASLMDSFRAPDVAGPPARVQTRPDQEFAPTTVPPPQPDLIGGPWAGLDGGTQTGVNGHPAGLNGAGRGTGEVAVPAYAQTPMMAPAPMTAPAPMAAPAALMDSPQVGTVAPAGSVTDEERTSYGVLLDRAAERGLLDSSEYEVRLRQLAEATTTSQMVAIVSELPAFTPPARPPVPHQSRSAIQSASRTAAGDGQRRRLIIWVLMGVLVALALASLVVLALSVGRLSRSRNSMPPPPPAVTRPVSALRL